ncbi:ABC transporter substrate-binding protein [Rariglobus hedericola]|uniref:ABC transporter substrate-binding protein n=1 Tax=Rariglobus hedericola TaxID=2597822 RepID=A0A556QMJ0_9BACT|nr:ABC transporter substrate-binding protein [Rariglobus hedericola]TSJ77868.1 ABC transporter substrate-binding protein [Rariglobus hedericola]
MRLLPHFLSAVAVCLLLTSCDKVWVSADVALVKTPAKIIVQLDWVAEPEHGGFYQAQAKGFFKDAGLDVEIIPGGPNAFVIQKVATGQAHIGQGDSTNTLLAISQGIPVTQIAAVFQNDPSVLMLHAGNPVTRFEDLNGKTLMARPEWAFLPYLKKKYSIDFKLIPQNYSVANFVATKDLIQQGYYIAEPYHIIKAGGEMPRFLYAWDAGFDAYAVLVANKAWLAAHPAEARAFVKAYIKGWNDYLTNDPAPAHALMKAANANNTDEFMLFSRKMIIDEKLVTGRGPEGGSANIGRITRERFQTQINQLEELAILPKDKVTVDQAMTTDYLP